MSRPTNDEIIAKAMELSRRTTSIFSDCTDLANWAIDQVEIANNLKQAISKPEVVMSFEEWNATGDFPPDLQSDDYEKNWRYIWNTARRGMIPAANAIQIPPESEWPERATHFVCGFQPDINSVIKIIQAIPRSKPQWRPKEGEWVWKWLSAGWKVTEKFESDHEVCRFAAIRDFNTEKDWTWDQFLARGDTWEEI